MGVGDYLLPLQGVPSTSKLVRRVFADASMLSKLSDWQMARANGQDVGGPVNEFSTVETQLEKAYKAVREKAREAEAKAQEQHSSSVHPHI